MNKKLLFTAGVETSVDDAAWLENQLELAGVYLVQTQEVDAGRVFFTEYFPTRKEAVARLAELKPLLRQWMGARKFSMKVRQMAEKDWSESWKKTFHTARVSRRIVIKPSWETYKPRKGDCVIELDPGMSFGTGLHPTTRACLRFIDSLAGKSHSGMSMLDAGCGSGVLAIAAAKLGFTRVVAVDFDPVAVKASRENCLRNGVSKIVKCVQADLLRFKTGERFGVVAANMFKSEHERFMEIIAGSVAAEPPGYLLIAGTMLHQYPDVVKMYTRRGLEEVKSVRKKEWKSGVLRKRHRGGEGWRAQVKRRLPF